LGIAVSSTFDLAGHGVATIGEIATGLPSVDLPSLTGSQLWVLVPSALGLVLVIFSEALAAAQEFADKHRYRIDPNQELIALGAANLGSGLLGGLAGGGSLSQSAVNEGAGARSEMSPIIATVLSLVTVIALTPLFQDLPEAVLGALIIHAVSGLMKVGEMRSFHRLVPREFWLGMITLAGVVVLDVLPGLLIGVSASILLIIYRASRPRISILGADPADPDVYVDVRRHPEAVPVPGILVVRPDAPLRYVNAQTVRDTIDVAIKRPGRAIDVVIVDVDMNDEIDITSAEMLSKLAASLERHHSTLVLAHVHQPAMRMARATGLLDEMGDDRTFPNIAAAVAWARQEHQGSTARSDGAPA
ncbi:MAG: SulP family inorganic anion transporter, partial [Actinoplanes sp.]